MATYDIQRGRVGRSNCLREDTMMRYPLLTLTLVLPLTVASAQAKKHGAQHPQRTVTVVLPDQITWGTAPAVLPVGAKLAVLEGDPTRPRAYTMRLLMPDGYQISPHFHPATEHRSEEHTSELQSPCNLVC